MTRILGLLSAALMLQKLPSYTFSWDVHTDWIFPSQIPNGIQQHPSDKVELSAASCLRLEWNWETECEHLKTKSIAQEDGLKPSCRR